MIHSTGASLVIGGEPETPANCSMKKDPLLLGKPHENHCAREVGAGASGQEPASLQSKAPNLGQLTSVS